MEQEDVSGGSWSTIQMANALLCRVLNQGHVCWCFPALTLYHVKALVLVPSPVLSDNICGHYRGADKSLARPTSPCILFDCENISFDASLVLYIYIYIYK
jgi:hypothetical protein